MVDYHAPLMPEGIYHVLSRAVGNEKLFLEDENCRFFLERLQKHIGTVADIYCYCLLPNHFHLLVGIRKADEIKSFFEQVKPGKTFFPEDSSKYIMQQFSNLLNSYTKAFNKRYNRKGSLFIDNLRRVEITTEAQFCATAYYVHRNPVHHGYCKELNEWKWSSYNSYFIDGQDFLNKHEVIKWYGSISSFQQFHNQPLMLKDGTVLE